MPARERGERDGFNAAEYAAYSGEAVRDPERRPGLDDEGWLDYRDGWGHGVEAFDQFCDEA